MLSLRHVCRHAAWLDAYDDGHVCHDRIVLAIRMIRSSLQLAMRRLIVSIKRGVKATIATLTMLNAS